MFGVLRASRKSGKKTVGLDSEKLQHTATVYRTLHIFIYHGWLVGNNCFKKYETCQITCIRKLSMILIKLGQIQFSLAFFCTRVLFHIIAAAIHVSELFAREIEDLKALDQKQLILDVRLRWDRSKCADKKKMQIVLGLCKLR